MENKKNTQKVELTCVYDKKAGTYSGVTAVINNAVAIRSFADACQDEKSLLNKHAEDYDLVNLGNLDIDTGKIEGRPNPIVLANATQFKKQN